MQKIDATDAGPLAGASFNLRLDQDPAGPDPADPVVDTCTTTSPDGSCTVTGLDFGTYYWEEVTPPTGYVLPNNVFSAPITIDAANAATALPILSFEDARVLTELTVEQQAEKLRLVVEVADEVWGA